MWCDGSGTWNDPYIIENVTIDAPTGSGILIENSKNDYFIIRNCSIYHVPNVMGTAAIKLSNTENGTIIKNICSNNGNFGIYLDNQCNNNTISNNIVEHNDIYGIYSGNQCNNNTIANNKITNSNTGILISDEDNIIFNNTLQHNNIGLYISGNNNTLSENILFNHSSGIFITSCLNNDIIRNEIINCSIGIGLYEWASYTTISNNTIINSTEGIHFDVAMYNIIIKNLIVTCTKGISTTSFLNVNNTFYQNIFKNNGIHAEDNMNLNDNKWDNGAIGNYWDDYLTMGAGAVDDDDDGIGDIPYTNIAGSANSQDNFPIWDDGDDLGPDITINSPSNSSSHSDAPTFTITIIDQSPINKTWYAVNNGTGWSQSITFSGTLIIIDGTLWGNLNNGNV